MGKKKRDNHDNALLIIAVIMVAIESARLILEVIK